MGVCVSKASGLKNVRVSKAPGTTMEENALSHLPDPKMRQCDRRQFLALCLGVALVCFGRCMMCVFKELATKGSQISL
jgi:hypothetical protein